MRIYFFNSLLALMLLTSACTEVDIKTPSALTNQGIMALSDTDPFFGPNIFLAQEMESSSYLYSFLNKNGAPTAIRIDQNSGEATQVTFYYAEDETYFVAEPQVGEKVRQWLVRGPYRPHWKDQRLVLSMEGALQDEPVFYLYGKEKRFQIGQKSPEMRVVMPVLPPTPAPTPVRIAKKTKKTSSKTTKKTAANKKSSASSKQNADTQNKGNSSAPIDPKDFRPLNTDQQAILLSKGYAERAINGDIIHVVKAPDETLEVISSWYTGSGQNTFKVATANNMGPTEKLLKGERIYIPRGLIKKYKSMPKGYTVQYETNPSNAEKNASEAQ